MRYIWPMPDSSDNPLGQYLKDRRARLDPATLGFTPGQRRTPGLRREEVAHRAHVSATWYTWLEQGRGGAPSADVLDRIARALILSPAERQHLFFLALGHAPEVKYQAVEAVPERLQRVLDAMEYTPAFIRTTTWDIVAWNRAATAVLRDYASVGPEERNSLRMVFCDPNIRSAMPNWEHDAPFVVASFRAETVRAGARAEVKALIEELCERSSDFARLWAENDVNVNYGETPKQMIHPIAGPIALDPSTFAVDGRPDLSLVVYNPADADTATRIRPLIQARLEQRS